MDLAVANVGDPNANNPGGVSILLGNGDGTFQPASNIAAGKNPVAIKAADFNGDGRADLVLIDSTGVGVLLGHGNGTFGSVTYLATASGPISLAVADLDGDNKLDLVVSASSLSVLLGNGDGRFQTHVDYSVSNPGCVAIADVNGDGKLDLVTSIGHGIETFFGSGNGTFQPAVLCACGTGSRVSDFSPIAAGDINGDGHADLAVMFFDTTDIYNPFHQQVQLIGNGDGTFQPNRVPFKYTGALPSPQLMADLDGDGHSDLVWSFSGSLYVSGASANNFNLGIGSPIFAADLDGDKSPDIIGVNNDNTISVFLNSTGADFSISASKPTPGTLSGGQSSTSTVTLKHTNAFDDPIALACSVQPAQAGLSCSLDSNSVTFDANGNTTATLTMTAGAATASLAQLPWRYHACSLGFLWLPVVGFAFVGAGFGGRSAKPKRLTGFVLTLFLLAEFMLQAACGSGSSGGPHSRTYTITVTGTSESTQHSTTTTLTVRSFWIRRPSAGALRVECRRRWSA